MPDDVLKLDRSFIRHADRDASLASMVKAMIQLAEGLGMVPLAEGIEIPADVIVNGFAITQEPAGGSPQPTSAILLYGRVAAEP